MNTVDERVKDYLKRAREIESDSFLTRQNYAYKIIEIAKMIQTEELNNSNMKYFEEKK